MQPLNHAAELRGQCNCLMPLTLTTEISSFDAGLPPEKRIALVHCSRLHDNLGILSQQNAQRRLVHSIQPSEDLTGLLQGCKIWPWPVDAIRTCRKATLPALSTPCTWH